MADRRSPAASSTAGRTGLPVTTVLALAPLSSGFRNPPAIASTRAASALLARPITAFCSWISVGTLAPRRRIERRQCRIAAEADDGRRLDPADQRGSLAHAAPDRPQRARQHDRIARADVAEAIGWTAVAGKRPAKRSARSSVARCTVQPRAISSCASASAGNRCPPVPPAASRIVPFAIIRRARPAAAPASFRSACAFPAACASAPAPCPSRSRSRSATSRHRR